MVSATRTIATEQVGRTLIASHTMRAERAVVLALAIVYLIIVSGFALATPYGEAPDEALHLRYIEFMDRHHEFPLIGPGAITVSSFHPPLYYLIGAGVVSVSRALTGYPSLQTRLGPVQRERLPEETGLGGPFARFVHPPEERWLPWPYILRILSILMGLGVVLLTYATARALLPPPAPGFVPIVATAFAALIPQANSIRASISNGNLADLIGAWIVLLLVQHIVGQYSRRRVIWLGVAFGLAFLTKFSLVLLCLPIMWALWIRRGGTMRGWLRDLGIVAVLVALIAGWYYVWRTLVYGDLLALTAWHNMLPPDNIFRLSDLFWFQEPFRMVLWNSFWGMFGFHVLPMPGWIYNVFSVVTLLGIVGGITLLVRRALSRSQQEACGVLLATLLLMYGLVIGASTYLVAWQGREMYPALSSVCVLLGLGLGGPVLGRAAVQPAPPERHHRWLGVGLASTVILGLLVLNVYVVGWLLVPGLN